MGRTGGPIAVLTAVAVAVAIAVVGCGAAPPDDPATWVLRSADPIATTAADGPLDEIAGLSAIADGATVVGLGESAHGTHDQFTLRHRMARYLVEREGFRTIAFELDLGGGTLIDRYVTTGEGDPRTIVAATVTTWRSAEMLALVEWMRGWNQAHPGDQVRFLGADVLMLRPVSIEVVTRFVADVAPDRLTALHADLDPVTPGAGPAERQIRWFFQQQDKAAVLAHARAVRDLVAGLAEHPDKDLALKHAEAVLGFYENYAERDPSLRGRLMASTIGWWQARTGHKIAYWAANVHVAAVDSVDYAFPPTVPQARLVPAGHLLRERYGAAYVPVAALFGAGAVLQGWETGSPSDYQVPPPGPGTLDHVLAAGPTNHLLDLDAPAGPTVARWLAGPATLRLIGAAYDPAADAQYFMRVTSLRSAFDAVAYVTTTGPARLLAG